MTLAPRQQQALAYIAEHIRREGIAPTYREIGDALGIRSTNGVSDHVKALIRKGCLNRAGSGHARAITLTDKGRALLVSDDPEHSVPKCTHALSRVCLTFRRVEAP